MQNAKNILIVEDELSVMNMLRNKLMREGFRVQEAMNGKDGLKIALKVHPDLILLDLLMPKMDGMNMLKKLREENEWGRNVPVIILTNLTTDYDEQLEFITQTKPIYYMVKSDWDIVDVVEKIKESLIKSSNV